MNSNPLYKVCSEINLTMMLTSNEDVEFFPIQFSFILWSCFCMGAKLECPFNQGVYGKK